MFVGWFGAVFFFAAGQRAAGRDGRGTGKLDFPGWQGIGAPAGGCGPRGRGGVFLARPITFGGQHY